MKFTRTDLNKKETSLRGSMTKQSVGFPHVIASQKVRMCGGVKQSAGLIRLSFIVNGLPQHSFTRSFRWMLRNDVEGQQIAKTFRHTLPTYKCLAMTMILF